MSIGDLLRGFGAAVATAAVVFLVGAAVLPGRRVERVRQLFSRQAVLGAALFGVFYAMAALLTAGPPFDTPSDTTAGVTIETVGRATRARLLLDEGASSDSPPVLLLAWFSLFFRRDPLPAAAPLRLAIYAASALLATEIVRSAFRLLTRAAAPGAVQVGWIRESDVRLSGALVGYAAIALVIHSLIGQARAEGAGENVSGRWRAFEALRGRRFSDATIQLRDATALDRPLAGYYFPGARLSFADFRSGSQPPPLDAISERTPMFIQHLNCDDVGHKDVLPVPRFGCLLLAPPGAQLEQSYPFDRRFLFISHSGMTQREPGGRWNVGAEMEWRIAADPSRTPLDRDLYLNVRINPYLPANVPPHRVRVTLKDGVAELPLDRESHVSMPVKSGDWIQHRLWTLPVRVSFPDGRTMLFHELSLTASPQGTMMSRGPGRKPG